MLFQNTKVLEEAAVVVATAIRLIWGVSVVSGGDAYDVFFLCNACVYDVFLFVQKPTCLKIQTW